jgi:hypothetical protein
VSPRAVPTGHHEELLNVHLGNDTMVLIGLGVVMLVVLVIKVRGAVQPQKDPQRIFTTAQRLAMFKRAGNRCEHKPPFLPRCRSMASHGDHVYPHSRGGATTLSNGQAMCQLHNQRKGATVPSALYIWRLERRRRTYFPPGQPVEVFYKIGSRR